MAKALARHRKPSGNKTPSTRSPSPFRSPPSSAPATSFPSSASAARASLRSRLHPRRHQPTSPHLLHLQQVAAWASASVPPLGAFLGARLAATCVSLGCPPPPLQHFTCERCESILQVGINCSVRVRKANSKKSSQKGKNLATNIIYLCHYCSFKNRKPGTPKAYVKTKLSEAAARNKLSEIGRGLESCTPGNFKVTGDSNVSESPGSNSKRSRRKGWLSLKQLAVSTIDTPATRLATSSDRSVRVHNLQKSSDTESSVAFEWRTTLGDLYNSKRGEPPNFRSKKMPGMEQELNGEFLDTQEVNGHVHGTTTDSDVLLNKEERAGGGGQPQELQNPSGATLVSELQEPDCQISSEGNPKDVPDTDQELGLNGHTNDTTLDLNIQSTEEEPAEEQVLDVEHCRGAVNASLEMEQSEHDHMQPKDGGFVLENLQRDSLENFAEDPAISGTGEKGADAQSKDGDSVLGHWQGDNQEEKVPEHPLGYETRETGNKESAPLSNVNEQHNERVDSYMSTSEPCEKQGNLQAADKIVTHEGMIHSTSSVQVQEQSVGGTDMVTDNVITNAHAISVENPALDGLSGDAMVTYPGSLIHKPCSESDIDRNPVQTRDDPAHTGQSLSFAEASVHEKPVVNSEPPQFDTDGLNIVGCVSPSVHTHNADELPNCPEKGRSTDCGSKPLSHDKSGTTIVAVSQEASVEAPNAGVAESMEIGTGSFISVQPSDCKAFKLPEVSNGTDVSGEKDTAPMGIDTLALSNHGMVEQKDSNINGYSLSIHTDAPTLLTLGKFINVENPSQGNELSPSCLDGSSLDNKQALQIMKETLDKVNNSLVADKQQIDLLKDLRSSLDNKQELHIMKETLDKVNNSLLVDKQLIDLLKDLRRAVRSQKLADKQQIDLLNDLRRAVRSRKRVREQRQLIADCHSLKQQLSFVPSIREDIHRLSNQVAEVTKVVQQLSQRLEKADSITPNTTKGNGQSEKVIPITEEGENLETPESLNIVEPPRARRLTKKRQFESLSSVADVGELEDNDTSKSYKSLKVVRDDENTWLDMQKTKGRPEWNTVTPIRLIDNVKPSNAPLDQIHSQNEEIPGSAHTSGNVEAAAGQNNDASPATNRRKVHALKKVGRRWFTITKSHGKRKWRIV